MQKSQKTLRHVLIAAPLAYPTESAHNVDPIQAEQYFKQKANKSAF
jgi:hypothetical protein